MLSAVKLILGTGVAVHGNPGGDTVAIPQVDMRSWRNHAAEISVAVVADALDALGHRRQCPQLSMPGRTLVRTLVGRCRTTLWMDFAHSDPDTYALELAAVDSLEEGDVMIAATGGSHRSGIWGELLTTAAIRRGATGVVTDGAIRDIAKTRALQFAVFAQHRSPYDSLNRQKVVARDVPVEIDGIAVHAGDIVVADEDGIVFVPHAAADRVLAAALAKSAAEDQFRDAVKAGMPALEAYAKYEVL